jgi:hypothetical protein
MSPSTPPPPLPEDANGKDNLEATGEKTHQVEPETEKQTVESNTPSTMTSSSVKGVDDDPAPEEKAVDEPPKPAMEYPKGIEAFFIMTALVLSITLCSLDQVSSTTLSFRRVVFCQWQHITLRQTNALYSDHCGNRYSKNYRPISQP